MTDAAASTDDDFAAHLAALDEAVAGGSTQLPVHATLPAALRTRLEKGLASLQKLNRLRAGAGGIVPGPGPSRVGRFEVTREIGRGGFGVVLLAFDPLLGRDVAVKIPHPGLLAAPDVLDRFRREARAAAGLSHPNVVPVFDTGEVGPVVYIVSAYYPGGDLAAWLAEHPGPVPAAAAAGLVAGLAAGVEHAHLRGILHRDLKPANVLLDWDAAGADLATATPRVTDFGLARLADGIGMTVSQVMLGTPAYMAPEQATGSGEGVGPAADVYSLGAILYELLAGRPPFRADTPFGTLDLVRSADPVPPSRWRPGVPRDLETVCLKCLEKDPARRYPSAVALGDDLHRFLAGRPVAARRVGPLARVWRIVRRNPTAAALAGTLAVALAGGFLGVVVQWQRAEVLAAANARARDAAEVSQALTDRDVRRAQGAVYRLTQLGEELVDQPATDATGRAVLFEALGFYQTFAHDRTDTPLTRYQAARAHYRSGGINRRLGRYVFADDAYRRATGLLDALLPTAPDRDDFRHDLARCLRDHGTFLRECGGYAEAGERLARAAEQANALAARMPDNRDYAWTLASTRHHQAVLLAGLRRYAEAEDACRACAQVLEGPLFPDALPAPLRADLARSLDVLGQVQLARGDVAAAEDAGRRALALWQDLARGAPSDGLVQRQLGRCHAQLAAVHAAAGRQDEADAASRAAAPILESAAKARLASPHELFEPAYELIDRADRLRAEGRDRDADRAAREARETAAAVSAAYPGEGKLAQRVARELVRLAEATLQRGDTPAATRQFDRAAALDPDNHAALNGLAWALACDPDRGPADRQRAVAVARQAVRHAPDHTHWNTLGACLYRAGDTAGAVAALNKSVSLHPRGLPGTTAAYDELYLALCRDRTGDRPAAQAHRDRAAALVGSGRVADPHLGRLQAEVDAALARSVPVAPR